MPEYDTDTSSLWWLKPDWHKSPNMALVGMEMAQKQQQQSRDFALKMAQHNLDEKQANVDMVTKLQQQKMTHDYMDDFPRVNAWAADPEQPVPTDLKSPKSMELIDQIKLRHSQSIVAKDSTRAFAERVKNLNVVSPELAGKFAPMIGRIPTSDALYELSLAETQAEQIKGKRLQEPVAPGERVTAKVGGVTVTKTGEKVVPDSVKALEERKVQLREDELALRKVGKTQEAQRLKLEQARIEDVNRDSLLKQLNTQYNRRDAELVKRQTSGEKDATLEPLRTEMSQLQSRIANRIRVLTEKTQQEQDTPLETTPEPSSTPTNRTFNYVPGQGLKPVE